MTKELNLDVQTTPSLSPSQKRVLQVVLENVIETGQCKSAAPLSVVTLSDFRESFPSLTTSRAEELMWSIMQTMWHSVQAGARSPNPLFHLVRKKGQAFVVEVDKGFLEHCTAALLSAN